VGREDLAQLDSYRLKSLPQEEQPVAAVFGLCQHQRASHKSVGKFALTEEGENLQGVLSGTMMGQLR